MMYEVELKFPLPQADLLLEDLKSSGVHLLPYCLEVKKIVDTYYTTPGDSAGKVFRVRSIMSPGSTVNGSARHYLTCKGKPLDTPSKTRREIEIECNCDFNEVTEFVELLGCTKVGVVEKIRQDLRAIFSDRHFVICVDKTAVGQYLEIELLVEAEEDCASASDAILELAGRLKLGEPERRSYFELLNGRKA